MEISYFLLASVALFSLGAISMNLSALTKEIRELKEILAKK